MTGILIVDDEAALRRWERRVLEGQRYVCDEAGDVPQARAALADRSYELALLDINLPGGSGIELLAEVRQQHPQTAVLMITGQDDLRLATTAIELGAYGYLVKPVRAGELLINVTNALHRRRREAELLSRLERLQYSRRETEDELRRALEHGTNAMDLTALVENETVHRLVRLAEFRDSDTGRHLLRMGRYCEVIGRQLALDEQWCAQLRVASELHDVGKVGIPDSILLKPGRLTEAEFEVMQTHAELGYRILSDGSDLLHMAATVAYTHHEWWDGSGYPRGLAGDQIPVEGRIAATADVFDALTSDRVYRPAFPVGMALEMMEAERDRHFQSDMLDAVHGAFEQLEGVRREFQD